MLNVATMLRVIQQTATSQRNKFQSFKLALKLGLQFCMQIHRKLCSEHKHSPFTVGLPFTGGQYL